MVRIFANFEYSRSRNLFFVEWRVRMEYIPINKLVLLPSSHLHFETSFTTQTLELVKRHSTDTKLRWIEIEQYSHFKFKCRRSFQHFASFVPMSHRSQAKQTWDVRASTLARNTHNLIRDIIENLQVEPNPNKQLIALSVGKSQILKVYKKSVEAKTFHSVEVKVPGNYKA